MSSEEQNLEPEIAHILSIDVVGYSKLLVNEQIEVLNELKRIVREAKCSCAAQADGRLIRLPTGDGMVLLFFRSPEEPLQCAVEISEALQNRPHIQVRMGAHSGPVNKIEDVNDRPNMAGAGLNMAQRVLDCGDAGHILLSKRLADDLAEYSHWRPHLYDLGECVVKHGFRLHLVNFYNGSIGNPKAPLRFLRAVQGRHFEGNARAFLGELKRRNVYKVATAYAVISWLLIQAASILFSTFEAPAWVMKIFVIVIAAGFAIALGIAWAFEMTPEGFKRTEDVQPDEIIPQWSSRKFAFFILTLALIAASLFAYQYTRPKSPTPARASASLRATNAIPEKSIAVLPFENLSDDKQNAYFADGVQGEILTLLTKVADLKVISRISVMKYRAPANLDLKQIAEVLRVRYFLEGSVQRVRSEVRVTALLVDALTNDQLWADNYDGDLADVFKIQTDIARQIVTQLEAKFTPEEKAAIEVRPTGDLVAYELYLRAKRIIEQVAYQSNTDELATAAQLLEEATARDPSFHLAYCQLASAYDQMHFFGNDPTPRRLALAEAAVDAAIRLRPDAGETHLASANHYYFSRDYDRALRELTIAQQKLPNDPLPILRLAYIERRKGNWPGSTQDFERALELDPRNLVFLKQLAHSYSALRRYADERKMLDRAVAIAPDDPALQVQRATIEFDARGDPQPMHKAIEAVLARDPAAGDKIADNWYQLALCEGDPDSASRALAAMDPKGAHEESVPYPKVWCEGIIARLRNDPETARTAFGAAREEIAHIVEEQPNFAEGLSALGMVDAALGNKEAAIRAGQRAVELLPPSKDAIVGPLLLRNLATIYAWTGEKAAALQELKKVASMPTYLSYGLLLRHPFWAPLREEPGFKEILASLASPPAP